MSARSLIVCAVGVCFSWATTSCESPVEDALIAAEGDEVAGVGESEFHRYGQRAHIKWKPTPMAIGTGQGFGIVGSF